MDLMTYRRSKGLSQAALARFLTESGSPATQSLVSQWESGTTILPPERCPAIEMATGVRCEDLRPDLRWHRDIDNRVIAYAVPLEPVETGKAAALEPTEG